ncbi:hypothetical protein BHE74_00015453 [Ensete ventricosum]|nr:hypothetical protein BHE74_00015453 [Ensete ventricosum]
MPPQDQAPVKDADFESMPMNLKEGDRYVVNHGEDLTAVDFDGYVSLAKKMQAWQEEEIRHRAGATEWMEQKVSLDNESEGTSMAGRGGPTATVEEAEDALFLKLQQGDWKRAGAGREWLWRQMGRWQQLGAAATVEDLVGSDGRLMEEKAAGSRGCSGRGGRRGSSQATGWKRLRQQQQGAAGRGRSGLPKIRSGGRSG